MHSPPRLGLALQLAETAKEQRGWQFCQECHFLELQQPHEHHKHPRVYLLPGPRRRGWGRIIGGEFAPERGIGRAAIIRVRGLKRYIIPFPSSDLHIICPSNTTLTHVFNAYVKRQLQTLSHNLAHKFGCKVANSACVLHIQKTHGAMHLMGWHCGWGCRTLQRGMTISHSKYNCHTKREANIPLPTPPHRQAISWLNDTCGGLSVERYVRT